MPTTDELQSQINALQSQLNSILGMADDDYIHQYSGEEIDAGITAAGKAVRYDLAQSLTTAQQKQARDNIGADAVQGAVRYDLAQALTTAQQAQARGNIAAAPNGYGLGDYAKTLTGDDDLNTICYAGWYCWGGDIPKNAPDGWRYSRMRVDPGYNSSAGWTRQTVMHGTDGNTQTRWLKDTPNLNWQPWEWVNPPMTLGVEYRTTERYLGKPVYAKLINLGKLPNNAETSVQDTTIGKIAHIVDFRGEFTNSNGTPFLLPYGPTFANSNVYTVCITVVSANSAGTGLEIRLLSKVDFSAFSAMALVKYTKTTD